MFYNCSAILPGGIQVAFYNGAALRRADARFAQIDNGFDIETFENDIAILQFANAMTFPIANVIRFSIDPVVPAVGAAGVVYAFGFTTPDSTGPNQVAIEAAQTVAICTSEDFAALPTSHYCARDTGTSVICPGDNGSGLFIRGATPAQNELVITFIFIFITSIKFLFFFISRLVLYPVFFLVALQLQILHIHVYRCMQISLIVKVFQPQHQHQYQLQKKIHHQKMEVSLEFFSQTKFKIVT